jgi:hypothetical protein
LGLTVNAFEEDLAYQEAALQGVSLEEAELERAELDALAESAGAGETPAVSRGGPLYRIRVTLVLGDEAGLSMEALVRIRQGGSPPFATLWRRFGLAAQGAVTPDEGADRLRE